MPKNLWADIDWHRGRIAFYLQAMAELAAGSEPDKEKRLAGLRAIVNDLRQTLADLELLLSHRTGGDPDADGVGRAAGTDP